MTMGNGVSEALTWNDRVQPVTLQANAPGGSSLLDLGDVYDVPLAEDCGTERAADDQR